MTDLVERAVLSLYIHQPKTVALSCCLMIETTSKRNKTIIFILNHQENTFTLNSAMWFCFKPYSWNQLILNTVEEVELQPPLLYSQLIRFMNRVEIGFFVNKMKIPSEGIFILFIKNPFSIYELIVHLLYTDCKEVRETGYNVSGVFSIYLNRTKAVKVGMVWRL